MNSIIDTLSQLVHSKVYTPNARDVSDFPKSVLEQTADLNAKSVLTGDAIKGDYELIENKTVKDNRASYKKIVDKNSSNSPNDSEVKSAMLDMMLSKLCNSFLDKRLEAGIGMHAMSSFLCNFVKESKNEKISEYV